MSGNSETPKVDHSHDGEFFLNFAAVLGALFVITAIIIVAALVFASDAREEEMPADEKARIAQRVAPMGTVTTDPSQLVAVAAAEPAGPRSAADIVSGVCAGCHTTGVPGAPQMSDTAAWKALAAKGLDALTAVAIKGQGGMPARGGDSSLSDDEIKAAVKEMLNQAGAN